MKPLEKTSNDLFHLLRSRFSPITIGDDNAEVTTDPAQARFFSFAYKENEEPIGTISISIISNRNLKVYYNNDMIENMTRASDWYSFLKELRYFAKQNLLSFDARDIQKDQLDSRDYNFIKNYDRPYKENEVEIAESAMFGTKRKSIQQFENANMIVYHRKTVDETVRGSRSRYIESIFIESNGERFRFPINYLNGARAMAVHVSEGGTPYDAIGQHIISTVTEMQNLAKFSRLTRRHAMEDTEAAEIRNRVVETYQTIKRDIMRMQNVNNYRNFAETFTPAEASGEADVTTLQEKFTRKVWNEQMNDLLPSVQRALESNPANKAENEKKSTADQIAKLENMLKRMSGNTSSMKMKKYAIQKKIQKLKSTLDEEQLDEILPAVAGIARGVGMAAGAAGRAVAGVAKRVSWGPAAKKYTIQQVGDAIVKNAERYSGTDQVLVKKLGQALLNYTDTNLEVLTPKEIQRIAKFLSINAKAAENLITGGISSLGSVKEMTSAGAVAARAGKDDDNIDDDIDENAFNQAAAAAARSGKEEFEFDGKTYKTKMDKDTAYKLNEASPSVEKMIQNPNFKLVLKKDPAADRMIRTTKFTRADGLLAYIMSDIASRLIGNDVDAVANFASEMSLNVGEEGAAFGTKMTPEYKRDKQLAMLLAKKYLDDIKRIATDDDYAREVRKEPGEVYGAKKKRTGGYHEAVSAFESWVDSVDEATTGTVGTTGTNGATKPNATNAQVVKALSGGDANKAREIKRISDKLARGQKLSPQEMPVAGEIAKNVMTTKKPVAAMQALAQDEYTDMDEAWGYYDEEEESNPVKDAIIHRLSMMHGLHGLNALLRKHGLDHVEAAIDDVAGLHADVEELGSSDISIMVKQVMNNLGATNEDEFVTEKTLRVKADQDYDGDGEIESPEEEYMGSRDRAIKKIQRHDESDDEDFIGENLLLIKKFAGL